jgi:phosphopantothenoylcysteine synthetase/decarboxylase
MGANVSRNVLITSGSTRNPIDAMRHLAAYSSGRTGAMIARYLVDELGCKVHMLGSPEACLRVGEGVTTEEFGSTRDLMTRMAEWIGKNPSGVVIHAAAVGDYETEPKQGKIPSGKGDLSITLKRAPKIIDHIKRWAPNTRLIGFKAAGPNTSAEQLVGIAKKLLERVDADYVFGNVIGSLETTATIVDKWGAETFENRREALRSLCVKVAK